MTTPLPPSTKPPIRITSFLLVFLMGVSVLILAALKSNQDRVVFSDYITIAWNVFATLALFWAVKRITPDSRSLFWAWFCLAIAQFTFALADITWTVLELGYKVDPFPSLADAFYLLYYPLFLAGILLLPSKRIERFEIYKLLLDIGVVLLSAGLVWWIFLLAPTAASGNDSSLLEQLISMAYPVGDLILLAAILRLFYRPLEGIEQVVLIMLAASAAVSIFADALFGYQTLHGSYVSGDLLDIAWPVSYGLMGMAGLWQAWFAPGTPPDKWELYHSSIKSNRSNSWKTYFLYFWILASLYLLIYVHDHRSFIDFEWVVLGVAGIIGLVIVRHVIMLNENQQLIQRLETALDMMRNQTTELQVEIEKRFEVEKQLAFESLHDGLTGLPNRKQMLDRLWKALEHSKRRADYEFSLIFLDIDHFKQVNDSLGHGIGDQLLISVAERLRSCLRADDQVGRLGGDEFVILLQGTKGQQDAVKTVDRMMKALEEPFNLEGHRIHFNASFGIVADFKKYASPGEILRDADIAMYQAKNKGRARYEIFHPHMRDLSISRLELRKDLGEALEKDEFTLLYQPIFKLNDTRITGFEALLQWRHPRRGLLRPLEFIPIAEESGLIQPIGGWVLTSACRQLHTWQELVSHSNEITMSVNVSAYQLKQPVFVDQVAQTILETGITGENLKLEITEGIFLEKSESILKTFLELNALGVAIQIDDFGTGYSSLSYIQDFPIQTIKIDRAFVLKMGSGNTTEIVRTIISLAHDIGKDVIAEGIETEYQLNLLKKFQCDAGQGYLLGFPQDKNSIEKTILKLAEPAEIP